MTGGHPDIDTLLNATSLHPHRLAPAYLKWNCPQ